MEMLLQDARCKLYAGLGVAVQSLGYMCTYSWSASGKDGKGVFHDGAFLELMCCFRVHIISSRCVIQVSVPTRGINRRDSLVQPDVVMLLLQGGEGEALSGDLRAVAVKSKTFLCRRFVAARDPSGSPLEQTDGSLDAAWIALGMPDTGQLSSVYTHHPIWTRQPAATSLKTLAEKRYL